MNNKLLSLVLSSAFLMQGAVLAEEETSIAKLNKNIYGEGSVTLSGQLTEPTARVLTFRVVNPDGDLEDVADIYRMSEIQSDSEGNFSVVVYTDDTDINGEYTYYIGGRGYEEPISGSFYFYSEAANDTLAENIASKTTAEDVKAVIENEENQKNMTSMNCYIDEYLLLEEEYRTQVCNILVNEELTADNLADAFNKATAITELNREGAVDTIYDIFVKNAETLDIGIGEGTNTNWLGTENTTSVLKELFADKTYTSADAFSRDYEEKSILTAFNKALWNEMEELLTINKDVLGISLDFGAYEYKKNDAFKAMVSASAVNAFTSLSQIANAFNSAKNNLQSAVNTSGGSSSGGGSSGGRGGSKIPSVPVVSTMTNENIEDEEKFESSLNDTDEAVWAKEAVFYLEEKKIVSGDENKNFNPNDNITREQFVTMLALAFGYSDENAENVFEDIADNAWYKANVAGIYNAGIVSGISRTEFGVGKNITRQDMAAMLYRIVLSRNISMEVKRESAEFSDNKDIADYASEAVDYLYKRAVISGMGDGTFSPKANASKAQAAVMLSLVLKSEEGNK